MNRKYYAYTGNETAALQNGSFIRTRKSDGQLVQWMNGDCLGLVETVNLARFTEVETKLAETLIPVCCK